MGGVSTGSIMFPGFFHEATGFTNAVVACRTIGNIVKAVTYVEEFVLATAIFATSRIVTGSVVLVAPSFLLAVQTAVNAVVSISPVAVGMASCRNHFYLVRAALGAGIGLAASGSAGGFYHNGVAPGVGMGVSCTAGSAS